MKTHRPRKRFGQHFLKDTQVIAHIMSAVNAKPYDHLVEIGPGQGALTKGLLAGSQILTVIELDRDLIKPLKILGFEHPQFTVIETDALKVDYSQFAMEQPIRLIGNLPYNISTPLLFHILKYKDFIEDMHFMLQKEVVERLTAQVNSAHYGRLSIMIQYHCQALNLFEVSKHAFYPPPQVESAIVRLIPYSMPPFVAEDYQLFHDIVMHAFSQRRKTLHNSLKKFVDDILFEKVGIDPKQRAENLSVAKYVSLANLLHKVKNSN